MNLLYKFSIWLCQLTCKLAEKFNKTNTQAFINWEDKLNEISVKTH